ncbi:unnamed protein product [Parnassius mnemosyne]|uniref:Uncharacterized protein n=2 Tax=Parnassius mnemosyne TaxID=213953 RepID=A0AAV1LD05_9NEOP
MQYHKDQTLALQEYLGSSSSLDLKSQPGPSLVENITTTEMQYHKNQAAAQDLECQPGPSFCNVLKNITNSYTQHHKMIVCKEIQKQTFKKTDRENYLYNKCRRQVKKICQLKSTIQKMRKGDALNILEKNESVAKLMQRLTPSFALMLQAQLKNDKKKFKGRRWTFDEKVIALRLFKRSPTCYRLLRRMWCLPSPSTLNNLLRLFLTLLLLLLLLLRSNQC